MKSVLIIGMGHFGHHLAKRMLEMNNYVMVVDSDEEVIRENVSDFPDAQIGDCTNEAVLRSLDVENFDICFVMIGDNFQSSLVITLLLKKLGAKHVVAKANQDVQAEILKTIGADEIIYPEKELSEKLAVRYNAQNIFEYIPLTAEYSMYEIPVMPGWVGSTIAEVDVRNKYRINIVAVKNENKIDPIPAANYIFRQEDHIVVIGTASDVFKLTARIDRDK